MFLTALRMTPQVMLFGLALHMYGLPAWEKLNKQSTIVINTSAFHFHCIASINKYYKTHKTWEHFCAPMQRKAFSSVQECLSSETYRWQHFINDTLLGFKNKLSLLNNKDVWVPGLTYAIYGRLFTFHPNLKDWTSALERTSHKTKCTITKSLFMDQTSSFWIPMTFHCHQNI